MWSVSVSGLINGFDQSQRLQWIPSVHMVPIIGSNLDMKDLGSLQLFILFRCSFTYQWPIWLIVH